jgi:hypothetical protein
MQRLIMSAFVPQSRDYGATAFALLYDASEDWR